MIKNEYIHNIFYYSTSLPVMKLLSDINWTFLRTFFADWNITGQHGIYSAVKYKL